MTDTVRLDPEPVEAPRTAYFDRLRVVAIVGVVVLHVAAQQWYVEVPGDASWQILNAYDSAVRFCVPVFFMISGALFLDPARPVTYSSLLRRSAPRVLVAFLVWSAFYALMNTFVFGEFRGGRELIEQVLIGNYHLWFLWALLWLYVATPILRAITATRSIAIVFVSLAAIGSTVVPLLDRLPVIGPIVAEIIGRARIDLVLGYTLFFVLGHLLHNGLFAEMHGWVIASAGFVAVVITAAGTAWLTARHGAADSTLYEYLTPNVLVASVAVFLLVKRFSERPGARGPRRMTMIIGAASFGIYLVHPFFLSVLASMGITTDVLPVVIGVPLLTAVVLILSLLVATVLHRIPKIGRYLA
ncbi:acyltransferase [Microbacterium bovistercoris]|uniref:Acyltransferase n=1 Tax=Microbacterium bovistercoris TaxID=2293570 RepID=A0A371NXP2_9MICO|nr:acyltransferase family protein [Microbacterium bovistercoris]REJ07586.1 acyltransferase [Microbacterium bovistercoris]